VLRSIEANHVDGSQNWYSLPPDEKDHRGSGKRKIKFVRGGRFVMINERLLTNVQRHETNDCVHPPQNDFHDTPQNTFQHLFLLARCRKAFVKLFVKHAKHHLRIFPGQSTHWSERLRKVVGSAQPLIQLFSLHQDVAKRRPPTNARSLPIVLQGGYSQAFGVATAAMPSTP
jgi:hypothetical protein